MREPMAGFVKLKKLKKKKLDEELLKKQKQKKEAQQFWELPKLGTSESCGHCWWRVEG